MAAPECDLIQRTANLAEPEINPKHKCCCKQFHIKKVCVVAALVHLFILSLYLVADIADGIISGTFQVATIIVDVMWLSVTGCFYASTRNEHRELLIIYLFVSSFFVVVSLIKHLFMLIILLFMLSIPDSVAAAEALLPATVLLLTGTCVFVVTLYVAIRYYQYLRDKQIAVFTLHQPQPAGGIHFPFQTTAFSGVGGQQMYPPQPPAYYPRQPGTTVEGGHGNDGVGLAPPAYVSVPGQPPMAVLHQVRSGAPEGSAGGDVSAQLAPGQQYVQYAIQQPGGHYLIVYAHPGGQQSNQPSGGAEPPAGVPAPTDSVQPMPPVEEPTPLYERVLSAPVAADSADMARRPTEGNM